MPTSTAPIGVPPPSLSSRTLVNPSRYFPPLATMSAKPIKNDDVEHFASRGNSSPVPLASSYLYLDDHGATRWQGEMSGFPLLDMLIEREGGSLHRSESPESARQPSPTIAASENEATSPAPAPADWFPDRQNINDPVRPEDIWMTIASTIPPELMDHLVMLFLKTTYYIMPFIHVPSFIQDYQNPNKWDTGFGSFIVAICCLASRHVDDVRVRSDPTDAFSAGAHYFDLFVRLRSLPGGDRPTLYTVQGVLLAAVYAIGRGRLSKGLALLSEAITLCIDAGLHRSVEQYDHFDAIETEVRKRTFWSVYAWDKQASVYFGRPPMIRLRDCDVPEPAQVDDDYITKDNVGAQPADRMSIMSAFVACNRLYVVVEAVLDVHPVANLSSPSTSFLSRASTALCGFRQSKDLKEAEALVDEWCQLLPPYWTVTAETMASRDVIRITQAERLHCLEHFVRMLIHRYRFSLYVTNPANGNEQGKEVAVKMAQRSALQIIAKHLEISSLGLMTYYGLFVIHQLTQAGRTLVAVLLESKSQTALTASSLEALKACIETCRLNRIPLEILEQQANTNLRPAWLRPVPKRLGSRPPASPAGGSPRTMSQADHNAFIQNLFETNSSAAVQNGNGMIVTASPLELTTNSQSYEAQLLPARGGLVEPLTQGSLAPFTADMFGQNDDVSSFSAGDLLAYLGGVGVTNTSPAMSYTMMQPNTPTPLAFDIASMASMTSTVPSSSGSGSGASPAMMT
ncbi:hypothetical protein FRB99_008906 [Tulasnella sp. 403]|nr:hypothetical protein FRB99_008906 [Tulasnella sp. 403]